LSLAQNRLGGKCDGAAESDAELDKAKDVGYNRTISMFPRVLMPVALQAWIVLRRPRAAPISSRASLELDVEYNSLSV